MTKLYHYQLSTMIKSKKLLKMVKMKNLRQKQLRDLFYQLQKMVLEKKHRIKTIELLIEEERV